MENIKKLQLKNICLFLIILCSVSLYYLWGISESGASVENGKWTEVDDCKQKCYSNQNYILSWVKTIMLYAIRYTKT